ncbi:MAG TPA: HU family DNA-binding protein [bacterium]|nr:HU family DNA-binding protein [bacterium]HPN30991.1 HU family DNA-binding protein [bacterium]
MAKAVAKVKLPDKYTFNSMVAFVAAKGEIPKAKAKSVIEDYLEAINAGVLSGARVPVGNFGKFFVKVRPASPKRKGRNPLTGQEIVIAAKPATKVPKVSFNKAFKESCKKAKLSK